MPKISDDSKKSLDAKACHAQVAESTDDDEEVAAFRKMFAILEQTPKSELGDHQITYLSERDTREFLAGLENPPPPTAAMVEALRAYRSRAANVR